MEEPSVENKTEERTSGSWPQGKETHEGRMKNWAWQNHIQNMVLWEINFWRVVSPYAHYNDSEDIFLIPTYVAFLLQYLLLVPLMMTHKWLSFYYSGIWSFVIINEATSLS
jgi:hypothetical protein